MSTKTNWEPIEDDRYQYSSGLKFYKVTLKEAPSGFPIKDFKFPHCVLEERYRKTIDRMLDYDVKPDDVFVCSLPRSGTTWTHDIVWLLMNNVDYSKFKDTFLHERFDTYRNVLEKENSPHLKYVKNHCQVGFLPSKVWTVKPKIIVVTRDQKDAAISFYHLNKVLYGYTGSLEDFLGLYTEGLSEFGPFTDHLNGYWQLKKQENFLFITYEEMKANLPTAVKRIASFLEIQITEKQAEEISQFMSMDSSRKIMGDSFKSFIQRSKDEKLKEILVKVGDENIGNTAQNPFLRKGQVGSHKTEMPAEFIQKFDEIRENELKI